MRQGRLGDVCRSYALRSFFKRRTAPGISDARVFPKPRTNPWRGASPTYERDKAESHSFLSAALAAISLSRSPPSINIVKCMPARSEERRVGKECKCRSRQEH